MLQKQCQTVSLHHHATKNLSGRKKLQRLKKIHIKIRPSRQDSVVSLSKTLTDTSDENFNRSSLAQTWLIKSNNGKSFEYGSTSPPDFNERLSSKRITEDQRLRSENIERFKGEKSASQKRSRKRTLFGYRPECCVCLTILVALFLCAAALMITTGVLASIRAKKSDTSSTTTTTTTTTRTTSTSTSVTSSTTTSTSSTTTTTTGITRLTTTTEIAYPIWNTTAGQDSTPATVGANAGNFYPGEIANYAFDNTTNTKYTNFGSCNSAGPGSSTCGINTGLYLTPQRGPSSLVNIQFCTANDLVNRDPLTVTVEGSNQPSSSLTLGSSWTLIYNGSTGLQPFLTRFQCGPVLFVSNNSNWYSSYRLLVTSIRGTDVATQYSELRMMGYQ